ncbi:MAG: tRNA (guanosine(37)-N1)-methyltransferase TrmD [Spirochaetales bacterium]|nr:tRNA (guanosine(37)-N1)-methyltransferase TrmD [Spirochaetales bacterium]
MIFTVLTLFPEILEPYFQESIMAKAVDKGLVRYKVIDIRDFALDRHRTCDDAPYGGGPGMILKPEPLAAALDAASACGKRVVYPTPSGRLFNAAYAEELVKQDEVVLICGRYEGIDQRIIDLYVTDEVSLGDYVLSSGELASLVIVDTVYRLLDGVIRKESLEEESFTQGLLEYPQYTRPEIFRGMKVPEILLSGHHAHIERWKREKSLEKTRRFRPELLGERNEEQKEG